MVSLLGEIQRSDPKIRGGSCVATGVNFWMKRQWQKLPLHNVSEDTAPLQRGGDGDDALVIRF